MTAPWRYGRGLRRQARPDVCCSRAEARGDYRRHVPVTTRLHGTPGRGCDRRPRWARLGRGKRGNDVLCGGAGNDTLKGGKGNDEPARPGRATTRSTVARPGLLHERQGQATARQALDDGERQRVPHGDGCGGNVATAKRTITLVTKERPVASYRSEWKGASAARHGAALGTCPRRRVREGDVGGTSRQSRSAARADGSRLRTPRPRLARPVCTERVPPCRRLLAVKQAPEPRLVGRSDATTRRRPEMRATRKEARDG